MIGVVAGDAVVLPPADVTTTGCMVFIDDGSSGFRGVEVCIRYADGVVLSTMFGLLAFVSCPATKAAAALAVMIRATGLPPPSAVEGLYWFLIEGSFTLPEVTKAEGFNGVVPAA